ncbi:hypothetical protein HNS38_11725 [Lentimicrobium sp. L6]|uniref:hypothetical protein n=1 Tax=Lentimicrobium sp. L6 TaxID=2735916 RepID=UPI0015529B34|nr:hypothetical protein [Lentimicrobium sp. L6]NPD85435.1 hypothetical protein [Lentimicrobium sp. L6]
MSELSVEKCNFLFNKNKTDTTLIYKILDHKISTASYLDLKWIYLKGETYLDNEEITKIDKKIYEIKDSNEYFDLWKSGIAKTFPSSDINQFLQDDYTNYNQINDWIQRKAISLNDITSYFLSYLQQNTICTDRKIFYTQFNKIKFIVLNNEDSIIRIKELGSVFYNTILWFLDNEDELDFNILKTKFIYFLPKDQVRIIRKLFKLKAEGKLDLSIEKLDEITRFDLELFHENTKAHPAIPIDISTDVIIKALIAFRDRGDFLVESEALKIIIEDLKYNTDHKFLLTNYFEDCKGRMTPKFDWEKNGEIKKIVDSNNNLYYSIEFGYNPSIIEKVKLLPDKRYNAVSKTWQVPITHENKVKEFATENRFFLDFGGSAYANNTHFAKFIREEIPNGISFCEARKSNKLDLIFNKEFWWCANRPCYEICESIHDNNEWQKYTLLDFCEALNLNTDERTKNGEVIPKGKYYQFIGLVNRLNTLLEKLYCQDCNHILHPAETSNFASRTVVKFKCANDSCENNDIIYLNHCLNGKCKSIIDSRNSKKCTHGLYICEKCGTCCSDAMFKRRLSNLQLNGGFIHNNLRVLIEKKAGHLERGVYFCHKCSNKMEETKPDIFNCRNCDIEYKTSIYKFKRPHKHLEK